MRLLLPISIKALIVSLIFLALPGAAFCADWEEISAALTELNEQGHSRADMVAHLLEQDENSLRETLKQLRSQVKTEQQALQQAQADLLELNKAEQELERELAAEREEIEGIQGTVLGAAKHVNDLFEHSPLGPEFAEERRLVDQIMAKKAFPGMDEIRGLIALCYDYFRAGGETALYQGEFFADRGTVISGQVGRIGALGAVYRTPEQLGYLQANEDGRELIAVNGRIPKDALDEIDEFLNAQQDHLPLDISGGTVFLQLTQHKSFGDWLQSGGLLVWPILGIGLVALLLSLERVVFFLRIRANSDSILHSVTQFVKEGKLDECRRYCDSKKNYPTCRILTNSLRHIGQPQDILDNALEESLLNQMPRLERFLPTLAMFAAIAPLLGLLGTVTGMISTFQVINIFGTGDPKMMSGGISEALITTQVGLAVAIPIMFLHHIFERRVDTLVADLEEKGTAFKITLTSLGKSRKEDRGHAV